MKSKIFSILGSSKLALVLLFIFGVASGVATFIEDKWDTITAKVLVYNSTWFEVVMILLTINFILHIPKYKLLSREKLSVFIFHFAFILILVGAAITRYTGYEGMMPIREGEKTNLMYSTEPYLQVYMADKSERKSVFKHLYMTEAFDNSFSTSFDFNAHKNIQVSYVDFIPNAKEIIEENQEGGKDILEIVTTDETGRVTINLKEGESKRIGLLSIAFGKRKNPEDILILKDGDALNIQSPFTIATMKMSTMTKDSIPANTILPFESMKLHSIGTAAQFVLKNHYKSAIKKLVKAKDNEEGGQDVLKVKVTYNNQEKIIDLKGGAQRIPQLASFKIDDVLFQMAYGSRAIQLPFSIHLNDFILDRYPGSMSPSSYKSIVTLFDERKGTRERKEIFMNNVLDYEGYRFFQASYDQDELGTRLSVNHDALGTKVTYLAYFLLGLGFLMVFFDPKSRYSSLKKMINQSRKKRSKIAVLLLFISSSFGAFAQDSLSNHSEHDGHNHESHEGYNHGDHEGHDHQNSKAVPHGKFSFDRSKIPADTDRVFVSIEKEHADNFGNLLVQTFEGRFQPINSLAIDVLRKISRKDKIVLEDGTIQTANQFILDVMLNVDFWKSQKIIYIRDAGIAKDLGLPGKTVSYKDLFTENMQYKLQEHVDRAFRKEPVHQNAFDKEVIKLDERVNVFMMAMRGEFLKIFPKQNSDNNEWMTWTDSLATQPIGGALEDDKGLTDIKLSSITYSDILRLYIISLVESKETKNYDLPNNIIAALQNVQRSKTEADILPTKDQIELEVKYNKQNIFKSLQRLYSILAILLLILTLIDTVARNKSSKKFKFLVKYPLNVLIGITAIGFLYHTYGMGIRWYLTGHAPWSNGYEALLLIAWAGLLAGFIFSRFSKITLAATTLLAFFILMTAGHSNYDPQLTNLQPVLKSYWLIIHVAAITVSYGFFGLAFILGLINMVIRLFVKEENKKSLLAVIKELTYINELTISIGIALAAVGTFLGGVWANESWGRYWGWDAKETWALVIILIYGMVLHFRFIPKMKSAYVFNVASVWSFSTVLMTFFGVNYYLSKGLHSYARGETPVFPMWAWISIACIFILTILAGLKAKKYKS